MASPEFWSASRLTPNFYVLKCRGAAEMLVLVGDVSRPLGFTVEFPPTFIVFPK